MKLPITTYRCADSSCVRRKDCARYEYLCEADLGAKWKFRVCEKGKFDKIKGIKK